MNEREFGFRQASQIIEMLPKSISRLLGKCTIMCSDIIFENEKRIKMLNFSPLAHRFV